jgi:ElaB/YqjD/DUF883 family membrane-anchored ribosome-binding protein
MSDDQQIDEIREEIAETRGELSRTIDQIEEKLSPQNLQTEATDMVRQITDQLLGEFQAKSGELSDRINEQIGAALHGVTSAKAEQFLAQVQQSARETGASLWERIAQNPVPVAVAAMGMGLLATNSAQGLMNGQSAGAAGQSPVTTFEEQAFKATESVSSLVDQATSKLKSAADGVSEKADNLAQKSAPVKDSLFGEQGITGGLLALGLGMLAGFAIPETDRERATMAPLRDKARDEMDRMGFTDWARDDENGVVSQLKDTGGELINAAKETLDQTADAATSMGQQLKETATQSTGDRSVAR